MRDFKKGLFLFAPVYCTITAQSIPGFFSLLWDTRDCILDMVMLNLVEVYTLLPLKYLIFAKVILNLAMRD
jgi:hypothetical protein